MTEKWEQRAIKMNFKKAVIIFLITCFVVMISVPAALYGNFQNRINAWEQIRETDREQEKDSEDRKEKGEKEEKEEKDLEEVYDKFHLS